MELDKFKTLPVVLIFIILINTLLIYRKKNNVEGFYNILTPTPSPSPTVKPEKVNDLLTLVDKILPPYQPRYAFTLPETPCLYAYNETYNLYSNLKNKNNQLIQSVNQNTLVGDLKANDLILYNNLKSALESYNQSNNNYLNIINNYCINNVIIPSTSTSTSTSASTSTSTSASTSLPNPSATPIPSTTSTPSTTPTPSSTPIPSTTSTPNPSITPTSSTTQQQKSAIKYYWNKVLVINIILMVLCIILILFNFIKNIPYVSLINMVLYPFLVLITIILSFYIRKININTQTHTYLITFMYILFIITTLFGTYSSYYNQGNIQSYNINSSNKINNKNKNKN